MLFVFGSGVVTSLDMMPSGPSSDIDINICDLLKGNAGLNPHILELVQQIGSTNSCNSCDGILWGNYDRQRSLSHSEMSRDVSCCREMTVERSVTVGEKLKSATKSLFPKSLLIFTIWRRFILDVFPVTKQILLCNRSVCTGTVSVTLPDTENNNPTACQRQKQALLLDVTLRLAQFLHSRVTAAR